MKVPKKIEAIFYTTDSGNQPVREYLKRVDPVEDRRKINNDIRTVEYGWPIGMPVCRPLGNGISEVRTSLQNRISRVLFYIDQRGKMVLLHGFLKKTNTTPTSDLDVAETRKKAHEKLVRHSEDRQERTQTEKLNARGTGKLGA